MSSVSRGILSNYRISRILGKGTFSTVKLATDIRTNEKIAIKILEKNKINNSRDYNRINREINIVKKISHINIVQVFEIKEDIDKYYILMEYCENGELFDLILSKRKLSEEDSAYYFYQLVNGLEYIHLNNIIHRDLKPENLLLTKNNILKIIDFGLSNFKPEDNLLSTPCGSPCYASPEMVSGKKYNGITNDVWSIGIILYAMIYGYLPFENVNNNNDLLFKKIRECNVEYAKNNCLLALDLIKLILVPDFNQRITINEIKRHKFYLKGKSIFKRRHKDINSENDLYFNLTNNLNDNNYKKAIKKYSNSEVNSRIFDFYEKNNISTDRKNFNNNDKEYSLRSNNRRILNRRNINNVSPENIIRTSDIKYSMRSQDKNRQITNIEKNYFSILTTTNDKDRSTFSYNINNKTEIKLNKKNNNNNNQYTQRKSEYISIPHKYDKIPKIKQKLTNEKIYPSSNIVEFTDKYPDFNSFSIENSNENFYEPYSNIKQNKTKEKIENYRTSEIKKIISDKSKEIKRNDKIKIKEMKPISIINLRPKNELRVNIVSPDRKRLNVNLNKKYGTNIINLEKKNNNKIIRNKENISLNNNIYFNNDYLDVSNENLDNNKYINTFVHISHSKRMNRRSIKDKYFNNNNHLRIKVSVDKIKIRNNSEINERAETSFRRNNNYINKNIDSKVKKVYCSNEQDNNNYSSINNIYQNTRKKNYRRINPYNIKEKEESKEEQKDKSVNKKYTYSNLNLKNDNIIIHVNKNYRNNMRRSEYENNEKNKKNHETYTYVHRNTNDVKYKNSYKEKNKYIINNNNNMEEITKINNSYENQNRYDKYSRKENRLNINNINKLNMSNLPSITIDMNILNKNNTKYLKLYDAIKNKL